MTTPDLLILNLICFVTSAVSVVTGSTSAITVPVLFAFGLDPQVAIATNMFALTCMSIGATIPFLRARAVNTTRLPILITVTLIGSALGAALLLVIPKEIVPRFVSAAILALAVFSTFYRQFGDTHAVLPTTPRQEALGYLLAFLMGIYGGMFSAGYVTILTALFLASFRMTLLESIATTKLVNVFSSGIATAVFGWQGAIDYRLGIALGAAMFLGAWLGASTARQIGVHWLRRIYLAAIYALGLKTLIWDLFPSGRATPTHTR